MLAVNPPLVFAAATASCTLLIPKPRLISDSAGLCNGGPTRPLLLLFVLALALADRVVEAREEGRDVAAASWTDKLSTLLVSCVVSSSFDAFCSLAAASAASFAAFARRNSAMRSLTAESPCQKRMSQSCHSARPPCGLASVLPPRKPGLAVLASGDSGLRTLGCIRAGSLERVGVKAPSRCILDTALFLVKQQSVEKTSRVDQPMARHKEASRILYCQYTNAARST